MKKLVCLMLGLSMIFCLGSMAPAQTKAGLEFHGLYGFNFSDDDLELEKGWGGGASFVIGLGDFVKLDLGGDFIRPRVKDETEDDYVQLIPVTGTLRFGPRLDFAYIYVGGGGGYSFNKLDTESDMDEVFEIEDCATYHACGGFEMTFTEDETIGFRGEFRYVWLKPEMKAKATGAKADWKMDHMQARAGFVVNF